MKHHAKSHPPSHIRPGSASARRVANPLIAALGGLLLIVGGFLLLGLSYERVYAGRMFPGVQILAVSVGGQSYAEARNLVVTRAIAILDHPITLVYPDASSELITPRQLGLTLDPDALVAQAFSRGRTGPVWSRWSEQVLLAASGAAFAFTPQFDRGTVSAAVHDRFASHEQAARNASLQVVGGQLTVTPSRVGRTINEPAFLDQLDTAFRTLDLPSTIDISASTTAPAVTEADLAAQLAQGQQLTATPLDLVVRGKTMTVDSATLLSWLTIEPQATSATMTWNKPLIAAYVKNLAKKTDTAMKPRQIDQNTKAVLVEGKVGNRLSQAAAIDAIVASLAARAASAEAAEAKITLTSTEIPITDKPIAPSYTPGQFSGKYIEVDLSQQRLYQFEGDTLLATFTVSTGKWDTPTPIGTRYILNHVSYAYSKPYNLYMPWWMGLAKTPAGGGFNGYGLHELPEWKSGYKEGASHLGRPVSHGCIRLGVGPAKILYDWAPNGTPVVIHT